jgi:hypothetical protein
LVFSSLNFHGKSLSLKNNLTGYLTFVPAWVLSLTASLLAAIVISQLRDYINIPGIYITWGLLQVFASFLICIVHPGRVWLVPALCNILVILPAACDDTFWTTSFGLITGSGIVLSFFAARLGTLLGKR